MKKAIVIGSGFTGCMFAMMLKQKQWDVTVIDKSSLTGGGVRTFYHGGHLGILLVLKKICQLLSF